MHYILGGTKVAAPVKAGGFKAQQPPSNAGRPVTAQKAATMAAKPTGPGKFSAAGKANNAASGAAVEALNG